MGIIDTIKESIQIQIRDFIANLEKEVSRPFIIRFDRIKRKVMREVLGLFVMIIGILMLSFALVYFFIEYMQLTRTLSFLIIGAALLIIGLILRLMK